MPMYRELSRWSVLACLCGALLGCGKSASPDQNATGPASTEAEAEAKAEARPGTDQVVSLYIWSDYLAPDTLSTFEKQTGIKVRVSYFDSAETMEARMLTGQSGFDVVMPTSGSFSREIRSGAYRPLDKSRVPNLAQFDPELMAQAAIGDPGNAYGAMYMWTTYGLAYNKKMVAERLPNTPLTSWRLLFDPATASKLASCGINVVDDPVGIVHVVLKYLGRDPNTTNDADFEAAAALLLKIRPFIRNVDTAGEIEALANGDVCLSLSYSGDLVQAAKRATAAHNGIELDYFVPQEGSLLGFDLLAIPKDAPNLDNAYRLFNYLIDPKTLAGISNFIGFANASLAATPLMDHDVTATSIIYPTAEDRKRLIVQTETSTDQARKITRIWQRFKTGN
jgi:putrescine transport system substrate-binding protein